MVLNDSGEYCQKSSLKARRIEKNINALKELTGRADMARINDYVCLLVERAMAMDKSELKTVSIRLPVGLIAQLEELKDDIQADPKFYGAMKITSATVVRMALIAGMTTLKEEYAQKKIS